MPRYYAAYEKAFELPVYRPVKVTVVCDRGDRLNVETDRFDLSARGIINATGTWETPHIPEYPGADVFAGRQLHTKDYRTADEFAGKHVVIVGAGISAIQLLDEISLVTKTTWVSRRPPEFRAGPFDEAAGRAAVAIVEDRVRRGLPPSSVVSVTGLPMTPRIEAMRARGALERRPMFSEITEHGVRWDDGTEMEADTLRTSIDVAATGIELLAVAVIVVAISFGTVRFLIHIQRQKVHAYEAYKVFLGKALLLGLLPKGL